MGVASPSQLEEPRCESAGALVLGNGNRTASAETTPPRYGITLGKPRTGGREAGRAVRSASFHPDPRIVVPPGGGAGARPPRLRSPARGGPGVFFRWSHPSRRDRRSGQRGALPTGRVRSYEEGAQGRAARAAQGRLPGRRVDRPARPRHGEGADGTPGGSGPVPVRMRVLRDDRRAGPQARCPGHDGGRGRHERQRLRSDDRTGSGYRGGVIYPIAVPIFIPIDPDDPDGSIPASGAAATTTWPPPGAVPPGVRPLPPPTRVIPAGSRSPSVPIPNH